nr:reverse transcriptase domain-containing protein [Tanacetum cinerariifolium]
MPNLKSLIPYPSRHDNEKCRDQANEQIKKFYKMFKDMSFEISFTDALILMLKFASTLKALIGNKEKLSEMARTMMNEHCSTIILNKLPRKLGDPGKFLIPYEFSGMDECLALADLGASINLMPLSVWEGLSLPELTPTCMTLELADRLVSKPIGIAKYTSRALIDVHKGELTLRIGNEAITYNLDQTVRYSANYNQMTANKIDVVEFACEEYSQEEADAFLDLEDDLDSPKINPFYYNPEGDILLLEAILNSKPSPPLPNQEQNLPSFKEELKAYEAQTIKSSVDEPPESDYKLPVIIAKDLRSEEKAALIKVLKSHKRASAWRLSDIQGINPEFCTHKILMEEDYKPAMQQQRRVNPKIYDIKKKEFEKLLDAGLIYPISDSPWMLERLAGKEYYCFLDGFPGYFQIPIDPRDQEKTTFTCPYGTFTYRRMPFGLCNAPGTFQRFLGQRHEKHFKPIHYASKTMNDAKTNYTTAEKEMLA